MDQSPAPLAEFAPLWPPDRFAQDQALCIDFVNTVAWRGRLAPTDQMATSEAWLGWMEENEAMAPEALAELKRRASMWPFEAEAGFRRAIEFRESLYQLLRDSIEGAKSGEKAVLDDILARALESIRLVQDGKGWRWEFSGTPVDWETPLYPIALSTAQLLTSNWAGKLRFCEREECQWLFLDVTKNRSRKWCDMSSCGNVMKARRSYARRKRSTIAPRDRSESRPR